MENNVHPYYREKATDILRELRFDADADPMPLARWGEAWKQGDPQIAITTSDGQIVGHGEHVQGEDADYLTLETAEKYGLAAGRLRPILGMGLASISKALGRDVVTVKASRFSGPSSLAMKRWEHQMQVGKQGGRKKREEVVCGE